MRRTGIHALTTAMLLVVFALPAWPATKSRAVANPAVQNAAKRLTQIYTADQLQAGVYVGSNFCMACHTDKATYTSTNHASFVRRPLEKWSLVPGKGVIADFDNNGTDDFRQGLDFNTISSAFDQYKPNAPKLSVENGTYFVTIGSLKMQLVLTVAGQRNNSAQRYVVSIPVTDTPNKRSTSNYFAPIQYTPGLGWAAYSPANWYDSTNAPKLAAGIGSATLASMAGNHTSGCVGCHATGLKSIGKTPAGETQADLFTSVLYTSDDPSVVDYEGDGEMEMMNIGCEACHGPGSNHVLGSGDPTKIVNPAKLSVASQSEICGRCHITSTSVPNGTYNWPFNDATGTSWTPVDAKNGTALSQFYKLGGTKFADGKHFNGGRPYNSYAISLHSTFQFHQVGCPDCHDPHNEGEGMLIRESVTSGTMTIKTSAEDNTICISCHATYGPFAGFTKNDVYDMTQGKEEATAKIAKVTEAHTHHPYAPERSMGLSRCTGCHMVATAGGHSFDVLSPEDTLKYQDKGGMANGCAAGCHNNNVNVFMVNPSTYLGVKGTATGWSNAFDVTLANKLKTYFGENGSWWKTTPQP